VCHSRIILSAESDEQFEVLYGFLDCSNTDNPWIIELKTVRKDSKTLNFSRSGNLLMGRVCGTMPGCREIRMSKSE
jgi:hypothetical protein